MSEKSDREKVVRVIYYYIYSVKSAVSGKKKKETRENGTVICVGMPQIPTSEWIKRTVGAKNNRKKSSATNALNLLVREDKSQKLKQ